MAAFVRNSIAVAMLVLLAVAAAEGRLPEEEKAAGLVDCWGALVEIKSCSGEIFRYFVGGRRQVDAVSEGCCRAVWTITHNCWPTLLDSVGFTAHEAHFLRGYCDAALANGEFPTPLAPAPVGEGSMVVGSYSYV